MLKKKIKKSYCCEKCHNYWSCETKWYRGEHDEENICCPLCGFYSICCKNILSAQKKTSQKNTIRK